jgi:hypothetical protein
MNTAANPTEQVRSELKALKITSKMVSVRATSSGMNVVIKTRGVAATVEAICNKHSRIHRCEASGEILSGGNFYVSVEFDRGLVETMAKEVAAQLSSANDWQGFSITDSPNNGCGYRFSAWGPKGHVGAGHTRDQVIDAIAVAALKAGL